MFGRRRKRDQEANESQRQAVEQELQRMGLLGPGDGPIRLERVPAGGPVGPPRPESLRLRLQTGPDSPEPGSMLQQSVARRFGLGLWEVVWVGDGDGARSLDRDPGAQVDEDELFRVAIANSVGMPYRRTVMRPIDVEVIEIETDHPLVAAHAHVLTRHLDIPLDDGAVVGFPTPEIMLAVPITGTTHAILAAQVLQGYLAKGGTLSTQIYWWKPTDRELASPIGEVHPGHRPDLRPVEISPPTTDGKVTAGGDAEFLDLCQRHVAELRSGARSAHASNSTTPTTAPRSHQEPVETRQPPAPAAPPQPESLRLRVRTDLPQQLVNDMVSRELAPGLWEIVAIDTSDSMLLMPREPGANEERLFRDAVLATVEEPFTLDRFGNDAPVPMLHIGGTHEYMAGHVHVLTRYLDAPFTDGALVAFPVPQVVLVHRIGTNHPFLALAALQTLAGRMVADGVKPISGQVYWWRPSPHELAAPGRDVELGHRPDLRAVGADSVGGRVSVHGDEEFKALGERLAHLR
ncbi:hypothetical protein [Pseudonocardia sp. DLS-67]